MANRFVLFFILLFMFAGAVTKLEQQAQKINQLRDPFVENTVLARGAQHGNTVPQKRLFVYDLKYRDAAEIVKLLKELEPQLTVSAETEAKRLVFKTTPTDYQRLVEKLADLDIALEQILIEVKVLEINQNKLDQLGINWDFNQDGVMLSERKKAADFVKGIDLLLGNGSAKLMANPRVTTVIGKEALIHIGDQVPYAVPVEYASNKTSWQINYISAGIDLKIIPQKAAPGFIGLDLKPEVASIKQWKTTPGGDYPVISARKVETFLCLKDSESFMIGGLLNEEERENTNKIPLLGDIPFLGIFFVNKSIEKVKSDVVFLVTAKKI
jgi:type II secretory pathway component GspD/PulD (secretin)